MVSASEWYVRSSPTANNLNGVGYGNGLFVAVGTSSTILTSPDGMTWTARSAGVTGATFWSAVYGKGLYLLGGREDALLRSSPDGVTWTSALSTTANEMVLGLTFGGYGNFWAVGNGSQVYSGLILYSSSGLSWSSWAVPTTNRLLAVCAGPADFGQVAVGVNGTIVRSRHYDPWIVCDSGSTRTLRSVVLHKGRFIAGGDAGTVLTSTDGLNWTPAAPTSFNIRGLASSGDIIVAVGEYGNAGRLQVSSDGLTWPGESLGFAKPLNGTVYGDNTSFVAVGEEGLILQSIVGSLTVTNEWTKPTSGYWQEPFWSLGELPSLDQGTVAFRNPGWKALAIGANTTANYPDSLKVSNLRVESPPDSFNQLLLNWAGLEVPLVVQCGLLIGTNASLVSHYSGLNVNKADIRGSVSLMDGSVGNFSDITLGPGASLNVEDASLSCSTGMVYVSAGGELSSRNANISVADRIWVRGGECSLTNGNLTAGFLVAAVGGTLNQDGGVVAVSGLFMSPEIELGGGSYQLTAGQLNVSGNLSMSDAEFVQTGGTNRAAAITVYAEARHAGHYNSSSYSLLDGQVSEGSMDIGASYFTQNGGTHMLTNSLTIFGGGGPYGYWKCGRYELDAGVFAAGALWLQVYSSFVQNGGSASVQRIELNNSRNPLSPGCYSLELRDGSLRCGDLMSVTNGADILQTGGMLVVSNTLYYSGMHYTDGYHNYDTHFVFEGGTLSASNMEIYATWIIRGSSNRFRIANPGYFKFGGILEVDSTSSPVQEQLGRFLLASNAVINLPGSNTALEFASSADQPWAPGARLVITNWSGNPAGGGSARVIFGCNESGLTATQLGAIEFAVNSNRFPARILGTGEVVPDIPSLSFSRTVDQLVLDWPNGWLLQSATNVSGPFLNLPGVTPPYTNDMEEPQQFFRLVPSH